ncbi:MAG: hypothetical protein J5562_09425 [Clostridia bacterium]|nr:hypothetical protein [Clostridia bacterium]
MNKKRILYIVLLALFAAICIFFQPERDKVINIYDDIRLWTYEASAAILSIILLENIRNAKIFAGAFIAFNALLLIAGLAGEEYFVFFIPAVMFLIQWEVLKNRRFADFEKHIIMSANVITAAAFVLTAVFVVRRVISGALPDTARIAFRFPFVVLAADLFFTLTALKKKAYAFTKTAVFLRTACLAGAAVYYCWVVSEKEKPFDIAVTLPSVILWAFVLFKKNNAATDEVAANATPRQNKSV